MSSKLTAQADADIDLEKGKKIYQQVCFTCHGAHFEGGIGPALNDAFWRHGDSKEAIYKVISEGVKDSEMLAFKDAFSDEDRHSLAAYIVSQQFGLRSLKRAKYPRKPFKGKRFSPDLFEQVTADYEKPVSENIIFFDNGFDGVSRFRAKLHIQQAGTYTFQLSGKGRSSIFLDGEEVFYNNEDKGVSAIKGMSSDKIKLKAGAYDVEVYNEQKRAHQPKFHLSLAMDGGKRIRLVGRSLQGNTPKEVVAGAEAKVVRKWIKDISHRCLLCLLPNKVIIAFNPETGKVENAWKQAKVNQTPSLPDRSQAPSEVVGTSIQVALKGISTATTNPKAKLEYLQYQCKGNDIIISMAASGKPFAVTISPIGDNGYSIVGHSESAIDGFTVTPNTKVKLQQSTEINTLFSVKVQ